MDEKKATTVAQGAAAGLGFDRRLAKVVLLSSAGNILEWMDFTVSF